MSDQTIETSVEALLAGRPTLILSPHMDDAMLSAAALVLNTPSEVWTLFTGDPIPPQTTSWDLRCGFADSHETIVARKVEDKEAFADTPSILRHLPAWEGAYANPQQRRSDIPLLRAEITSWLEEHPNGVLVLPVCAGLHVPTPWWSGLRTKLGGSRTSTLSEGVPSSQQGHASLPEPKQATLARVKPLVIFALRQSSCLLKRAMYMDMRRRRRKVIGADGLAANPDHVTVRDLGLDLAKKYPGVQVVFFEDLPYLWHERGDAAAARVSHEHHVEVEKIRLPVDVEEKFRRLMRYTSQMPVMDTAGRLTHRESIPDHEIYWLLR